MENRQKAYDHYGESYFGPISNIKGSGSLALAIARRYYYKRDAKRLQLELKQQFGVLATVLLERTIQ
jgi:hypothetical protein